MDKQLSEESFANVARAIFRRWERWRIWYNFVLACLVVVLIWADRHDQVDWIQVAFECFVGAFIANWFYFAGPMAESYLQWLGLRSRAIMPILYVSGLLFSMLLATVTLNNVMMPPDWF